MNQIFFATKRAYHAVLRVTRRPLRSLGLTAARFDLLYALLPARGETLQNGILQSALRRRLGVSKSVVSRMLKSLEELGWVTRMRLPHGLDRRQRLAVLTAAGLQRIVSAMKTLGRASWRLVHKAICFEKQCDESSRLVHTDRLEGYLRGMRSCYGDPATLYYRWHPDD